MTMSRRNFLIRGAAVTAFAAGSGFFLMGGKDRFRQREAHANGRDFESVPGISNDFAEILYFASLAPSGHNAQPWYVRFLDERQFVVGCDPRARLPAIDPLNRETLLSLGAFAENLSLAAGAKGYDTTLEVAARNPSDQEILKVSLAKSKPTGYPLQRLLSRRKVKNGYRPDELKTDDVEFLTGALAGAGFYFPRGSDHAQCISEGTVEAFRAQSYRDDAQHELSEWIRFSRKEARAHRDGMTTDSMEIGGLAGWYVRNFMHKEDVMKKGFREKGIEDAARTAKEGGGWIVITSRGNAVADLIEAGRRLEHMWLLARERMIAIQPMSQMLEEKRWREEIAAAHKPDMVPHFILRVGYLDSYPAPVSLRRPVAWFLGA